MRVFIGLSDIASFIGDWKAGFESMGYKTLTGSNRLQHPYQSSTLDFIIEEKQNLFTYFKPRRISSRMKPYWDKWIKRYYFNKAFYTCDVFVFIWESFNNDFSDFERLKRKGKKIISILVGDEVRWYYAMKQEFAAIGLAPIEYKDYDYSVNTLKSRLETIRFAEKYSDIVLGQPNLMQLALRPYHVLTIPIVAKNFEFNPEQRKNPVIVHAPTDNNFKGTRYIEQAIHELKAEGMNFEYIKIQNMSHLAALDIYLKADIIVDQVLTPGGGKLAYECLAMGKVVVSNMSYHNYDQHKPAECPIVDANSSTIKSVLSSLIQNYGFRKELAVRGRPFIEKFHDPGKIVQQTMDALSVSGTGDYITPSFFRQDFLPESPESIGLYNTWTEFVSKCGWYEQHVKPGSKNNLVF